MPIPYYDWIAHHAMRTPEKIALIDLATERAFSYQQLDDRIGRLAQHLREKLAVQRGARVAVLALNTTDTLEVQFACGRLGAIFVPLNVRLTVPELEYIVGDAAPVVMIHDHELADTALKVAELCKVPGRLLYGPAGSYEAAIKSSSPLQQLEAVIH